MGRIADAFRNALRDFVTNGNPSSGRHNPSKADMRALGPLIEEEISAEAAARHVAVLAEQTERLTADATLSNRIDSIEGATAAGYRFYATKALLDADTGQPNGTRGVVDQDSTEANNGIYAFNSGSWSKIGDYIPSEVVDARDGQPSLRDRLEQDRLRTIRLLDALNGHVIDDEGEIIPGPSRTLSGYDYLEFLVDDLATLYRDRDATIPVTEPGQQVLAMKARNKNVVIAQPLTSSSVMTVQVDDRGVHYLTTDAVGGLAFVGTSATYTSPFYAVLAADGPMGSNPQFAYYIAANHSFGLLGSTAYRLSARVINATLGSRSAFTPTASLTPNTPFVADGHLSSETISSRWNGGNRLDAAAAGYPDGWQLVGAVVRLSVQPNSKFYGGILSHGKAVSEGQRKAVADYLKYRLTIRSLEKGTYDIFGCAGQSNCSGQGDYSISTLVPWGYGAEYLDGAIRHLSDPTKHYAENTAAPGNYSGSGSAWPSFAKKYYELTGRKALICGGGASGVGTATWVSNSALRERLAQKMLNAKAFIEAQGGRAELKGVIHLGGETDGTSALPAATTEANIATIHSSLKALTGKADLPMFIMSIDRTTNTGQDAAFEVTRQALVNASIEEENRYHVMPYQDFVGQGKMVDHIHWSQEALNEAGEIAAQNISAALGA